MKYFFSNYEIIDNHYSADLQDIFVLTATNGMTDGKFLEIGCNDPIIFNNTYILEKYFNWRGVSIDYFDDYRPAWLEARPNSYFRAMDAMKIDYESLLLSSFPGVDTLDYLQVDIEPSAHTLVALKRIPFEKYRFKTITFETDLYRDGDYAKNESRKFLTSFGYELVAGDVLHKHNYPYEDWWVHPDLIDRSIIDFLKSRSQQSSDPRFFLVNQNV